MAQQWISDNIYYIYISREIIWNLQSFISKHRSSYKMKVALFLLVICSVILAVSSVPAPDEDFPMNETRMDQWYSNMGWQFLMCRLRCRSSCLEQGYWNGACKNGATCHCYGYRGPAYPDNGFPMGF